MGRTLCVDGVCPQYSSLLIYESVGKVLADLVAHIRSVSDKEPDDKLPEQCRSIANRLLEDISMPSDLPLIFISYARPDLVAAEAVVKLLTSAGFPTWFDKKNLKGGQDWEFEIRKHIRVASLVLVCLSTNAVDRKGFFHKEMRYALDEALKLPKGRVFIVPVCFNECDIPDDLRRWQAISLFEPSASWELLSSIGHALDYGARVRMEAHEEFESAMREFNME